MHFDGQIRQVGRPGADGYYLHVAADHRAGRLLIWRQALPMPLGSDVAIESDEFEQHQLPGQAPVIEFKNLKLEYKPAPRFVEHEYIYLVRDAMRRPLHGYQEVGAGWLASRFHQGKGGLILDEPGLGKTTQAIAAILAMRLTPALIVCPRTVQHNWVVEVGYAKEPLRAQILINKHTPLQSAHFYICSYGLLLSLERKLVQAGLRSIVFDEAHELKAPMPPPEHRASVATRLAHLVRCVAPLTGTPILNAPDEYWRLLHMVDPEEWPTLEAFLDRYCRAPKLDELVFERSLVTSTGTRLERRRELKARIQPMAIRRKKALELPGLPAKQRIVLKVPLSKAIMKEYKQAHDDILQWFRSVGMDRPSERSKALAKLTALRRLAAMGKVKEAFPEVLDIWPKKDRPLVVFAWHRDVLTRAEQVATEVGWKTCSITGAMTVKKREQVVQQFLSGDADAIFLSIRASGVGLNLQGRSADTLFLERTWVPAHLLQAEDRVHRIGQERSVVTATYLDATGTIDEHLAKIVTAKLDLMQKLVDDDVDDPDQVVQQQLDDAVRVIGDMALDAGADELEPGPDPAQLPSEPANDATGAAEASP